MIASLRDWRVLIKITLQDPVKARQLFPRESEFIGKCDACQYGIGGVWLQGPGLSNPVVWRLLLPDEVITAFKQGKISISDLELAAHLFHCIILEFLCALTHRSIGIFSDNTLTVAWTTRLCAKNSLISGHLLRAIAILHHVSKSSPTVTAFKKAH